MIGVPFKDCGDIRKYLKIAEANRIFEFLFCLCFYSQHEVKRWVKKAGVAGVCVCSGGWEPCKESYLLLITFCNDEQKNSFKKDN